MVYGNGGQALGAEFYPWYDASYMMIGQLLAVAVEGPLQRGDPVDRARGEGAVHQVGGPEQQGLHQQ